MLSESYLSIIEALTTGKSNTAKVCKLVEHDSGLVRRVLSIANSAYYSVPGGIKTLKQALFVLGQTVVLEVALAETLQTSLQGLSPKARQKKIRAWCDKFMIATCVKVAAKKRELSEIDIWYTAALVLGTELDLDNTKYKNTYPEPLMKWAKKNKKNLTELLELSLVSYEAFIVEQQSGLLETLASEEQRQDESMKHALTLAQARLSELLGAKTYEEILAA